MGNPVGSSYLSEASRADAAADPARRPAALYEQTSAGWTPETTASTKIPAPVIVVVITTLAFGAFAHRWLAGRTRRRVNVGLVVGGFAIVVMDHLGAPRWPFPPAGSRSAKNTAARVAEDGDQPGDHGAAGARRRETLSLIRRDDEDVRKRSYHQRVDTMHQQPGIPGAPGQAIDKSDPTGRRGQAVDEVAKRPTSGSTPTSRWDYQAATQVALGTGEDDSAPAFDKLDGRCPTASRRAATSCATTSPQRPTGAVRDDRRRRRAVGGRGVGGGAGSVATRVE